MLSSQIADVVPRCLRFQKLRPHRENQKVSCSSYGDVMSPSEPHGSGIVRHDNGGQRPRSNNGERLCFTEMPLCAVAGLAQEFPHSFDCEPLGFGFWRERFTEELVHSRKRCASRVAGRLFALYSNGGGPSAPSVHEPLQQIQAADQTEVDERRVVRELKASHGAWGASRPISASNQSMSGLSSTGLSSFASADGSVPSIHAR